ncbi:hypothetical protein D9M70_546290 [compost metagenome]
MIVGFYQRQAGDPVGFLAGIGTGIVQCAQILLGLVVGEIALEHDRLAAEQGVDLGRVALEQARQILLGGLQGRLWHQGAVKHDLVACCVHRSILFGWKLTGYSVIGTTCGEQAACAPVPLTA